MTFFKEFPLITEDLVRVDQMIRNSCKSDVALINQVTSYIVDAGGKRIRPLLLLSVARAFGYNALEQHHYLLGAVIELIHTATLLHDDVIDESCLRRGRNTAHTIFGNPTTVLIGDFLYSRAFQMLVEVNNQAILKVLSDATNLLAEGEILQLAHYHNPDVTEEHYLNVIKQKTALLFEAAAKIGGMLCTVSKEIENALSKFGNGIGMAFQLIDDVLDYSGSPETTGKHVADDLREGNPTLPLIYVLKNGNAQEKHLVRSAIETGSATQFDDIMKAIKRTGALEYVKKCAQKKTEEALSELHKVLPTNQSPDLEWLLHLPAYVVNRVR